MDSIIFPSISDIDMKLPYYVTGIGIRYSPAYAKRENGITSFLWMHIREGEGVVKLENQEFIAKKGVGILIFPHRKYEIIRTSDEWSFDWVLIRGYGVERMVEEFGIKDPTAYSIKNTDYICKKSEILLDMLKRDDAAHSLNNSNSTYDFIISIMKCIQFPQQDYEQKEKFEVVHNYIIANYNKVITLEELAEFMGISPQYFCKIFKEVFGCRVSEYINRIRILKSKELIFLNRDMKFTEIAHLSGFDDASYFCAVFKKVEGCTPGEFKKSII